VSGQGVSFNVSDYNPYTLFVFRYINAKAIMAAGAVTSVLTVFPSYENNEKQENKKSLALIQ